MSESERFAAARDAAAASAASTGPAAERYRSALERYMAALTWSEEHAPAPEPAHVTRAWNIEDNLVQDVMTTKVISVAEDKPFKEIVDALGRHRVSAVPVVDADGKVIGVVSESDLLAKVVTGGDPNVRIPGGHAARRETRRKSYAETAGELMSSPAVTTTGDTSVVVAARTAALAHVRRLPVVDRAGLLVGIVTRSDLLRVFLRDDDEIRKHVVEQLAAEEFYLDPSAIDVAVHEGVVTLTGQVQRRLLIEPLLGAVRRMAGVVGVHDALTYQVDDKTLPPPRSPLY